MKIAETVFSLIKKCIQTARNLEKPEYRYNRAPFDIKLLKFKFYCFNEKNKKVSFKFEMTLVDGKICVLCYDCPENEIPVFFKENGIQTFDENGDILKT